MMPSDQSKHVANLSAMVVRLRDALRDYAERDEASGLRGYGVNAERAMEFVQDDLNAADAVLKGVADAE